MKILQLSKKFPYPLKDGESLAVAHMSRAIQKLGCDITLLCLNTSKHYFNPADLPEEYNPYLEIHSVEIDNHIKIKDAFLNLFSSDSYHVTRFISEEYEAKLIELLQNNRYDIVQIETLVMAAYIPLIRQYSKALVVMRSHNVEHEIWERVGQTTSFFAKRWYLKNAATKLRRFEVTQLDSYDLLVAMSKRDMDIFYGLGYRGQGMVIPIGLDTHSYYPNYKAYDGKLSISFIGALDWIPNQDGLDWFLKEIWPEAKIRWPGLDFYVAGRKTPTRFKELNIPGVHILGEVPDAADFLNEHVIMVAPILSGSGMRVKILESMALGRVVITTSIGCEGIDGEHLDQLMIADTAEDFLLCIEYCLNNPVAIQRMGRRARLLMEESYDSHLVTKSLLEMYQSLLPDSQSYGKLPSLQPDH